MKTPDAREVALAALQQVVGMRSDVQDALASQAGFPALEPRDRAFARLLVMTVLRRYGQTLELAEVG